MNNLMIDCSAGMNIILQTQNQVFSKLDSNQKKHTDELLVAVDELFSQAKLTIKDINNLCVCVGPGSFTGIRVAIAICKGLSIGTGAKIYTCSNFDIFSFGETKKTIYILDGFSDFVYTRIFDGETTIDACEHISDFTLKIKTEYPDYNILVQSDKIKNFLNEKEISSDFIQNKMIECFSQKIKNNEETKINQITPIYLRASQAEIERNEKLKRQE